MPSSRTSSKRARRSGSDIGRTSPPQDSALTLQQMFNDYKENVIRMVLDELARTEAPENALPCPFQRRNPSRYARVKDPACNGRGFKDIADLRDHIKRAHSSKYGCHHCKERFQGRDNGVEEQARAHRKKCKRYAAREVAAVSPHKPEVMSPDEDERYFQLDFRRLKGYSPEDKQYEQYWDICKAIWPEYESRAVFEQLDLRNKSGVIQVSRLSEIMERAISEMDNQFLVAASPSVSQYAESSSHASYGESPGRSSYEQSPSRAASYSPGRRAAADDDFSGVGGGAAAAASGYEAGHHQQQQSSQYNELARLHAIPQPVRYAEPGRNPRDSAYGSSLTDDGHCYRWGMPQLGEQMLTDPDYIQMDRDVELSGISAGDISVVSPGYQCYRLDDDELMMGVGFGEEDAFYQMS